MNYKKATTKDTVGTSFKGDLKTTYNILIDTFGKPHETDLDKIQAEWRFKFEDGTVATIYDWKEYETPINNVTDWHVGGNSKKAAFYINAIVNKNYRDLVRSAFSGEK